MQSIEKIWHDLEREFNTACAGARSEVVHKLNQLLRRFRQYSSEADWVQLALEGAGGFARQVALFSLEGTHVRLRGELNLGLPPALSFPLSQGAAFEAVRHSKDAVITLNTAAEISEPLSLAATGERAHLFPISNASRVAAILFASATDTVETHGLELVAGLASYALERKANASPNLPIAAAPPSRLPDWASFGASDRQLHLRARRFARVTVAEMQLSKPEACRAGREQSDLYLFLKNEIDKAREIYGKQFGTISSMDDYLHQELVRVAAGGDELKLGADYPGQLV